MKVRKIVLSEGLEDSKFLFRLKAILPFLKGVDVRPNLKELAEEVGYPNTTFYDLWNRFEEEYEVEVVVYVDERD